jgi:F-type H+-transporting ATPase subunit gamma
MPSARDIQRRIRSVSNIGKVTRAMEAVSASKMRRAQAATLASRAYARKAADVLAYMRVQRGAEMLHPLLQDRPLGRPAVVLITPDRGLTGGLVLNIIRFALRETGAVLGDDVAWVGVGRKGASFMGRHVGGLVAEFVDVPDTPTALDIAPIARLVTGGYMGDEFASVHVVYAAFKSVVRQDLVMERLLPIDVPESAGDLPAGYAFEPSPEAVLNEVLPRLLELRLYQAVLEAQASEHSARMIAMRNAGEAAGDLVEDLTLSYNKARQSDITSELLDIAGGAEALRRATRG